jgi:hypothetical protein
MAIKAGGGRPVRSLSPRREPRLWPRMAAILLLWLFFAQMLGASHAASITFDEGPHLAVGYATLRTGDLRLQPVHIHPPLANMLAAAPLLLDSSLPDPRQINGWEIASLSAVTDGVVWQNPHPARLAFAGRLPIILLAVLTGAVVWRWANDIGGGRASLLALALLAIDPNIVAHGALATTDMAVTLFGLLAFFLLYRYLRRPQRWRLAAIGLAVGLALASKVSAVLPLLLVGGILVLRQGRRGVRDGLILAGIAFVVVWAVYGFQVRPVPAIAGPLPLPAATHVEIYRSLQQHYQLGHPTFLAGENRAHGWWYYFPVAFLIKTPLPVLVLLAGALLLTLTQRRRDLNLALGLFPVFYLGTALFSTVDIGYRHLLPVLPFLYVFIGSRLAGAALTPRWARIGRAALAGLCLWLVVGAAGVFSQPLTFFNELAGGPQGGYRWLVDSNLDWGQNLWQLRDWMREQGVERVYYSHFSPARPEVYGIAVDRLPPDPRAAPFAPFDPAPGVYAIAATTLQGAYTPDVNTFAWFRQRAPVERLGHALFLYTVPAREPAAWAVLCADTLTALSPEQMRANLGRPGLRVAIVDCAQGWLAPTGKGTGAYALAVAAEAPPGAVLDLEARRAHGEPLFRIYRVGSDLPAETTATPLSGAGPLTFLGSWSDAPAGVAAGGTLEVRTYWRVERVPERPLSLMGHLLNAQGELVAVSDGLGVPIEQWQPGDVIIQRHRFQVPRDGTLSSATVATGAYWLDTMERLTFQDRTGNLIDQIGIQTITVLR